MEDNNEETGEGETNTTKDSGRGSDDKVREIIEQTNAAAERLEKATLEAAQVNAESRAREAMGGESEAGNTPEKPKEETPAEYSSRIVNNG